MTEYISAYRISALHIGTRGDTSTPILISAGIYIYIIRHEQQQQQQQYLLHQQC